MEKLEKMGSGQNLKNRGRGSKEKRHGVKITRWGKISLWVKIEVK